MSDLSLGILRGGLGFAPAAERRRSNYGILAAALAEYGVLGLPAEGVVPLGYPIRLKARDEVRRRLFEASIFPPVHWPIQGVVPDEFEESHRLAREMMTLPCDQRYDAEDMGRIVRLLRSVL